MLVIPLMAQVMGQMNVMPLVLVMMQMNVMPLVLVMVQMNVMPLVLVMMQINVMPLVLVMMQMTPGVYKDYIRLYLRLIREQIYDGGIMEVFLQITALYT